MRYHVSPPLADKIEHEARRLQKTTQEVITEILATSLAHVPSSLVDRDPSKCLCPTCPDESLSRGLCPRHYPRVRWFLKKRKLNEGWLVRHGRILPARGKTSFDYVVLEETEQTLPSAPPDLMPDTLWIFGYPQAQQERERMQGKR